ncbi:MAG: sigma-70 family RNA polymerase sigma factor [Planctomycetota bacterium]
MQPQGDPIPPEALLRHGAFVRAVAREVLRDEARADDAAQDAWVAALESPPRSTAALSAWLRRVTRRAALRQLRSGARRKRREESTAREECVPSVADDLGRESVLRDVGDAVLALREPYRSTVFGRYYEDKSVAELAREAGCPVATVESRLRRAHAMLRDRFERSLGPGDWRAALAPFAAAGLPEATGVAAPVQATLPHLAPTTAATGTLIMSTQIKWSVAAAVAAAGLLVALGRPDTTDVARDETSNVVEPLAADLAALDADPTAAVGPADDARVAADLAPPEVATAAPDAPKPTTGDLSLVVRYADGAPATGRTVDLMPWDGGNAFADVESHVTDGAGEVFVAGVPAGRVLVSLDVADGGGVDVVAGETTVAELEIPLGVLVRGRVVGPDGAGVADADVWVSDYGVDTDGHVVTRSGPDGAFEIEHLPSRRRIAAMAKGYDPAHLRQVVGAPGASVDVVLRLRAGGASIRGSVQGVDGVPAVGARVRFLPRDPGESSGTDGEPDLGLPAYSVRCGEDGAFRLDGLPIGLGRLYVRASGLAPFAEDVRLQRGDEVTRDLTLPAEGVVRGVVRDDSGAPVAGARLMAGDYGAPDFSLVHSRSDGSFVLDALPHGPITVEVEHDRAGRASADLVVQDGAPTEWNPELQRGLVLRGVVRTADGEPLADWVVDAHTMQPLEGETRYWSEQRRTDAGGRFEVPGCPAQALRAELRPPHYGQNPVATRSGFLAVEGELVLVVDESDLPSARVRGVVQDADGLPPAGQVRIRRRASESRFTLSRSIGSDGEFELGPMPAGTYALEVDTESAPARTLLTFDIAAEEELELPLVELPRMATVRLESAEPAAFSELRVAERQADDGPRRYPTEFSDPVGQDIVLWPGTYDLAVRGPGSAPVLETVELTPGRTVTLELEPAPGRDCVLRCVLPERAGKAAFLMVAVTLDGRSVARWTEMRPAHVDHTVRGRLESGVYDVVARTETGLEWQGEITVEAGSGEQRIELPLRAKDAPR